jgi:ureidoglycolate hydrolase
LHTVPPWRPWSVLCCKKPRPTSSQTFLPQCTSVFSVFVSLGQVRPELQATYHLARRGVWVFYTKNDREIAKIHNNPL